MKRIRRPYRLSFEVLWQRLSFCPMLLLLIPFVGGILLTEYLLLPSVAVVAMLCVVVVVGYFARRSRVAIAYIAMAMLCVGYLMVEWRKPRASMPYDRSVEMEIDVVGMPTSRDGYRVAEGRVVLYRDGEAWFRADDKVQLLLYADRLRTGDRVVVWGEVSNTMSGHEDYARLLRHRGYVGSVAINDANIVGMGSAKRNMLHRRAVAKLESYGTDSLSRATMESMIVGERYLMPHTLREAYASTGLSHLLAVSGLHLGIVMVVAAALMLPLKAFNRGHRIVVLISIAAAWLFASMSGMSPSAVRAAMMFSILQYAHHTSLQRFSLNTLVLVLLVMLAYRPSYLYDVSFQLSALAVAGILLWARPVVGSVSALYPMCRVAVATVVVPIVSTLWTLPVVSCTFGNIPFSGVVITPMVMMLAYVIVGCGIFILLLSPPLSLPFILIGEWIAAVQNYVVCWAVERGITGVDYKATVGEGLLCYAIYGAITLVALSFKSKNSNFVMIC